MKRIHLILLGILLCAGAQGQDLEPFKKGKKYGYKNAAGKVIIRAKYEYAATFTEGLAKVVLNKKSGFIDKTGKEVVPPKYDDAYSINKYGLAEVKLNNKRGFIDKTGKEVIPPIYGYVAYLPEEDLIWVIFNQKYGFFDKTGKEIISPKYDYVDRFFAGLARARLNGKWGYIDNTGKEIVPLKYDKVERGHGLIRVMLNEKSGFINIVDGTEVEVVPLKYDYISEWELGKKDGKYRVEVWENGKYGEIDNSGKITIPLRYESERMRMIWENLLAPIYGQINAYRSALPNSSNSGSWGSPDSSGSFTIERPYMLVSVYNTGRYKLGFERYSENNFNEQALSGVKTLVFRYDYRMGSRMYQGKEAYNVKHVTSYASYLIYFDVTKKEIIGYDRMPSPALPEFIDANTTELRQRNSNNDIIKKIESHLTTSQ